MGGGGPAGEEEGSAGSGDAVDDADDFNANVERRGGGDSELERLKEVETIVVAFFVRAPMEFSSEAVFLASRESKEVKEGARRRNERAQT